MTPQDYIILKLQDRYGPIIASDNQNHGLKLNFETTAWYLTHRRHTLNTVDNYLNDRMNYKVVVSNRSSVLEISTYYADSHRVSITSKEGSYYLFKNWEDLRQ